MHLVPMIRINRAIVSAIINSNHPIAGIAFSEIISFIEPILNPRVFMVYTLAIMNKPEFAGAIVEIYKKHKLIYYQAEICCLLLFLSTLIIQNI